VIILEDSDNSRRVRVFFADMSKLEKAEHALEEAARDEEAAERILAIGRLLEDKRLVAVTHREEADSERLHVFLRNESSDDLPEKIFACVLRPQRDVLQAIADDGFFVETFDDQVATHDHLSSIAIRSSIQKWIERCFPGVRPPQIILDPWGGEIQEPTWIIEVLTHGDRGLERPVRTNQLGGSQSVIPSLRITIVDGLESRT